MELINQHLTIPLPFFNPTDVLEIYPENSARLFEISEEEAIENGESSFQILEGNSYEYAFSNQDHRLKCINGIVAESKRNHAVGRIVPNIYVGTLTLYVTDSTQVGKEFAITIEVLATKFDTQLDISYRENYRFMLKDITDKCTELLMQINSPIEQNFETDFSRDNKTIYQRFSFIQSIVQNKDFEEAVHKIIASPKTNWDTEEEIVDIRKIKRFNNAATKQVTSGSNRIPLQASHPLYKIGIQSIPNKINSYRKIEHTDTPENRFIKHALEIFLRFAEDCQEYFKKNEGYTRPLIEASNLVTILDSYLSQSFFKEISRPVSLKLNSPVLQRKSGYREVLSAWLQFDLAAKLVWKGGDDVYKAGKRDIATLYEYWLFFTLYDLFKSKFKINNLEHEEQSYSHLFEPTKDGLNIMVKQGKHTALYGDFITDNRTLKVKFSYNRSFQGGTNYTDNKAGSYTTTLRPDYTLSVWPVMFDEEEAEQQDLIVHIHFDAKYKVTQFEIQTKSDPDLIEQEENNERKGIYKNVDLLKMHAYKDAIRRSGGAYVLYPGTVKKEVRGFHEIIPGLGAFSINPSGKNNDVSELSKFIDLVIEHLLDRASQRENVSHKTHQIYKLNKNDDQLLHEPLPEYLNGRKIIPDDTFVLVGYATTPERFKWYEEKGKYIFRMDGTTGSLELDNEVVNSKYLLLRKKGEKTANNLYEIISKGPKVFSDKYLSEIQYPLSDKSKPYYLAIEIRKVEAIEFANVSFNFKELDRYIEIQNKEKNIYSRAGLPFTVPLTKLMHTKVKTNHQQ
jgi:predicted component of viral defense system (DUF524 family)